MLPLTSKSSAMLTPPESLRKSVIARGCPSSSTSKSRFERFWTKRPLRSRTTAETLTSSTFDLNVAAGACATARAGTNAASAARSGSVARMRFPRVTRELLQIACHVCKALTRNELTTSHALGYRLGMVRIEYLLHDPHGSGS